MKQSRYIFNNLVVVHEGFLNNKELGNNIDIVCNKLILLTYNQDSHLGDIAIQVQSLSNELVKISADLFEAHKKEKLILTVEDDDDQILIADGVMFDGTRDQFRDCFFDNANNKEIINWCKNNNWNLVINKIKIPCVYI